MWGLEYALLFGAPENKLELFDGRTPLAWPFPDRETAEAHFFNWTETLCRWQGISPPPTVRKSAAKWTVETNGFVLDLHPRPIHLEIPFESDPFVQILDSFWRRDLWPEQPAGHATGWERPYEASDIALNLWRLFGEMSQQHGGEHSGRVAIALTERDAVEPDQYYFRAGRQECMIDDDYFQGRRTSWRRCSRRPHAGWTVGRVDRFSGGLELTMSAAGAALKQVELYELAGPDYRLAATYGASDTFRVHGFPDTVVNVTELFETHEAPQAAQRPDRGPPVRQAAEPVPNWLISPDTRLGLTYLSGSGASETAF